VNGKLRAKIEVERDTSEKELKELVLKEEQLKKWLTKPIKKIVVVPNQIVNIVI